MANDIQIKANSGDAVAFAIFSHAFGLTLSLCTLIAFSTLFPKFVGNQASYAARAREFNAAVGECLNRQVQVYGRQDVRTCKAAVNASLNFYEHR